MNLAHLCPYEMAATQSFLTLVSHRHFFPQMPRTFFKAAMTVFKLALWIQSSHLLNGTLHWSICPTIPANQHTFLCNVARPLFLVENRESSEYAASIILENLRASSQCQFQGLV